MRISPTKSILIKYTLLFAVTALSVFCWYIITGRTFVWHVDGLKQYHNVLVFYGEHLRNVLRTVFTKGSLNIPSFSFSIGDGGDILDVLHYYAVGSPLCALSVFFSPEHTYILYDAICITRLYLAGISFIMLCKTCGIKKDVCILSGALAYVFSYYAVYSTARHFFFLLPVIYLPLIIAGCEKIIKNGRPNIFTAAVFLAAVSNFYFFYMLVIITVIYALVRLIIVNGRNIRGYIRPVKDLFIYSLTGLLAAGIVFVPVLFSFGTDERFEDVNRMRFLYPLDYYKDFPTVLLTPVNSYWLCLCLTPAVILSCLYLFLRKGTSKTLKVLHLITLMFIIVPFFGQVFNGMSYMSGRWSFIAALLYSFTLSFQMDKLACDRAFFKRPALIFIGILTVLCLITGAFGNTGVVPALIILLTLTLILAFVPDSKADGAKRMNIILLFTYISVTASSFILNMALEPPYVAEARRPSEIRDYMTDDALAASLLLSSEDGFYRYLGQDLHRNAALTRNVSCPNYYWSLSNTNVVRYNVESGLFDYKISDYGNLDDRTVMTDLASVLYYIVPEDASCIPYGYDLTGSDVYEGHSVYINTHPISLTFSTDQIMSENEWLALSPAQKEEVMLYAAVVPGNTCSGEEYNTASLNSVSPVFTSTVSDPCCIDLTEESLICYFYFDGTGNSETRINLEGIRFTGDSETSFVIGASTGVVKTFGFFEDGYEYYDGRRDFTINLGYSEEPVEWIALAFTESGKYEFDSIEIECLPMDNTFTAIDMLNENTLENVEFGTDMITGDIDLSEDKILVFTIPYSEGWTATVDGEEYPLIRTDIKYMGLDLTAGHHDIVLKYKTPYFGSGVICSITGLGACIVLYIINRKKEAQNVK